MSVQICAEHKVCSDCEKAGFDMCDEVPDKEVVDLTCDEELCLATLTQDDDSCHRTRNVCFTYNNPKQEHEDFARAVNDRNPNDICFLVFQAEIGENGTRHLQGYAEFPHPVSYRTARKRLFGDSEATAWFAKAKGDAASNIRYCSKDRTRQPGTEIVRFGDPRPGQGKRSDLDTIVELIGARKSLRDICRMETSTFIKFHRGIATAHGLLCGSSSRSDLRVIWLHGPTGVGKSCLATTLASKLGDSVYWVSPPTTRLYWTGYSDEQVVVVDDFSDSWCAGHYLLRLLDKTPMKVNTCGNLVSLNCKFIVVTSSKAPGEHYMTLQSTGWDINQLKRRITCSFHVDKSIVDRIDVMCDFVMQKLNLPLNKETLTL
jgi:hypothetical protein